MKKLLIVLLAVLMLAGCGTKDERTHLEKVKEAGKLVIATEGMWEPWTYVDENGKLVGFDVEIGEEICKILGVEPEFVTGDFGGFLVGLDNGQYDAVINGIDITPSRQETYDFSEIYAYPSSFLIVAADNTDINSLEDLKGKKITNSAGSSYEQLGIQYGATSVGGERFEDTMNNLINGYADCSINSSDTFGLFAAANPEDAAKVKVVAKLDPIPTAIPLIKGENNATFRDAINDALIQIRNSGKLRELSIKYFGDDITVE